MRELRWLADQQSFELEGVSIYHVTSEKAQNSPGNPDRLSDFLNRLLRQQNWKRYRSSKRMLRTRVRLVTLDRDQQNRGRIGVADVVDDDSAGTPQPFGFIRIETDDPDETHEIARGVDRLYRFIDGHDVPLVCKAEIWLKETPAGGLRLDEIFVTLPYEDEIYLTFHNYPSLLYSVHHGEVDADGAKELRARIGREEPPEGRCDLEWDGRSLVTVLPPGNPAFITVANEDLGKVSGHFRGSADLGEDYVPLALIPRPDNEFDQKAVSLALPRSAGGDVQERHLAYLSRDYLGDSLGALIADLARFSGGEIQVYAEVIGRFPSAEVEPRLPPSRTFADAISAFLGDSKTPSVVSRPELSTLLGVTEHRGLPKRAELLQREALASITAFDGPFTDVTNLDIETGPESHGTRNLTIVSRGARELIGRIEAGLLILSDERQRERVTPLLAGLGGRFADQTRPYPVRVSEEFRTPATAVPNMSIRLHPACYRFEIVGGQFRRHSHHVAEYNPGTQQLWIEDEAIAEAVCRYAARLGLQVRDIGFPRSPWHLEEQVDYRLRSDRSRQSERRGLLDKEVMLSRPVREFLHPELTQALQVVWLDRGEKPRVYAESREEFLFRERRIALRRELFPHHRLGETVASCRLCGHDTLPFRTPYCDFDLAYCHDCLNAARWGEYGLNRVQALRALRELAEIEFGGAAPLSIQLRAINQLGRNQHEPHNVDKMMLRRMFIKPHQWSWTKLLADAGLIPQGVRRKRGTAIPAEDGHLCLSLHEKAVDDFLSQNEIPHGQEPYYPFDAELNPNTRRRADWILGDGTFVEMWGMHGDSAYDEKTAEKIRLADKHGIRLIGLKRDDVKNMRKIFRHWVEQAQRSG